MKNLKAIKIGQVFIAICLFGIFNISLNAQSQYYPYNDENKDLTIYSVANYLKSCFERDIPAEAFFINGEMYKAKFRHPQNSIVKSSGIEQIYVTPQNANYKFRIGINHGTSEFKTYLSSKIKKIDFLDFKINDVGRLDLGEAEVQVSSNGGLYQVAGFDCRISACYFLSTRNEVVPIVVCTFTNGENTMGIVYEYLYSINNSNNRSYDVKEKWQTDNSQPFTNSLNDRNSNAHLLEAPEYSAQVIHYLSNYNNCKALTTFSQNGYRKVNCGGKIGYAKETDLGNISISSTMKVNLVLDKKMSNWNLKNQPSAMGQVIYYLKPNSQCQFIQHERGDYAKVSCDGIEGYANEMWFKNIPPNSNKEYADDNISRNQNSSWNRDHSKDTDGDGIADSKDACPEVAGVGQFQGCPDTDGDGVQDSKDRCRTTPGSPHNNGCPVIEPSENRILNLATKNIKFYTGKSTLKSSSFPELDKLVSHLRRYPEYNVKIRGYTDDRGSAAANQSLSENRAKACANYLISKGITPSRISSQGYGETNPVATNNTPEGRRLNRRVEFDLNLR